MLEANFKGTQSNRAGWVYLNPADVFLYLHPCLRNNKVLEGVGVQDLCSQGGNINRILHTAILYPLVFFPKLLKLENI